MPTILETVRLTKVLEAVQIGTTADLERMEPRQINPARNQLEDWLENIDLSMAFYPASALVISCGTVTLDLKRGKVLLIWNHRYGIYQLPKGRKNIGESMLAAAVRETGEETGIQVQPLRLKVATRATVPKDDQGDNSGHENPGIIEDQLSNEFVSTCHYPDPQSETEALKIIFYFAATADSTIAPQTGTQEQWENLRAEWVPVADVADKLRFEADISAVMQTLADVSKTGYTVGSTTTGGEDDSINRL